MKKPATIISIATLYFLVYQLSPYLNFPDEVIITMFMFAPFLLVYIVWVVIRFGKPSGYHFEEKFYDDTDYFRA